jgi:diaminopimelate epimerase
MKAKFYKYQALGNDMLVLDPTSFEFELTPPAIRLLCDRHFGLGADGICYGPLPSPTSLYQMRFFNPDGSESGRSGNGIRIFARFLIDIGYTQNRTFEIELGGCSVTVEVKDETARMFTVAMGRLSFHSRDIPIVGPAREVVNEAMQFGGQTYQVTAVTIGNPHCVIFADQVDQAAAGALGPVVETDARFPQRTNVQLARVIDPHTLEIEIWERGAGYTLASGTSSCAAAGAALKTGHCLSPVEVRMRGGAALVEIDPNWQVKLTGSVEAVAVGELGRNLVARLT